MTAPIKLSLYLIRRFTIWLLVTGTAFSLLIFLGDFLDMLKLASKFNQGNLQAAYFTVFPCVYVNYLFRDAFRMVSRNQIFLAHH